MNGSNGSEISQPAKPNDMQLIPVGIVHTPYKQQAPFRPDQEVEGEFYLEIDPELEPALEKLDTFSHIIVLYQFDQNLKTHLKAHPPGHPGLETGTFASRSPNRVNKIGMNVVRLLEIKGNRIYTSPMDALDGSPVIDIKPYIKDLDCFPEANSGWLNH